MAAVNSFPWHCLLRSNHFKRVCEGVASLIVTVAVAATKRPQRYQPKEGYPPKNIKLESKEKLTDGRKHLDPKLETEENKYLN